MHNPTGLGFAKRACRFGAEMVLARVLGMVHAAAAQYVGPVSSGDGTQVCNRLPGTCA